MSLEGYDGLPDTLARKCKPYGEFCENQKEHANEYTIFGFELGPMSTDLGPLTLEKQGNSSVSVVHNRAHSKPIVMICMMIYESLLEMTPPRQVIADFTTRASNRLRTHSAVTRTLSKFFANFMDVTEGHYYWILCLRLCCKY